MSVAARIGFGVVGAMVAASLSACGSDAADEFAGQSADAIMKQAKHDTQSLKSVHLAGSLDRADGRIAIDLAADDRGDCSGTMGLADTKADVLRVDGASYMRGDAAFWRKTAGNAADQIVALLGDKWAKLPASQDAFGEMCDLDRLFSGDPGEKKTYSKGKEGSVGGRKAIEIEVRKGTETERGWIATEGKHYLLKLEKVGGTEPGSFVLSDFNQPVKAEAPAEGEYVDFGALGRG